MGPEKRLVIKTDVYTLIEKNTFRERERAPKNTVPTNLLQAREPGERAPLLLAARSKE